MKRSRARPTRHHHEPAPRPLCLEAPMPNYRKRLVLGVIDEADREWSGVGRVPRALWFTPKRGRWRARPTRHQLGALRTPYSINMQRATFVV